MSNIERQEKAKIRERIKAKMADKLPGHTAAPSLRITNDNISEHREKVLAKGKKFKYPVQVSRNKLIVRALLILLVVALAFGGFVWLRLYRAQDTGDLYYSVTKLLPLPVARVDGETVRYDAYLRRLRSDIHYYVTQEGRSFNSDEGRKELNYHRRYDLQAAEQSAYAAKLAREHNITVSDKEVEKRIDSIQKAEGSTAENTANTLQNYYGWTLDDYKAIMHEQMLEQKVAYAIDDAAKDKLKKAQAALKAGQAFEEVAKQYGDSDEGDSSVTVGANSSDPTGVLEAVKKLKVGQMTDPIQVKQAGGDYYYYIARMDGTSDTEDGEQVSYSVIAIRLSKFADGFAKLQSQGKIQEYIAVPSMKEIEGN